MDGTCVSVTISVGADEKLRKKLKIKLKSNYKNDNNNNIDRCSLFIVHDTEMGQFTAYNLKLKTTKKLSNVYYSLHIMRFRSINTADKSIRK